MKHNSKQRGNQTLAICLLGAACVVALLVLIAVALTSASDRTSGFTPPPFDPAALSGIPEVDESLGWSELSLKPGYVAHVCGVLRANADETAEVWFSSDAENTVWMKLRMKNADGETIGETGILKPGEYVEKIKLTSTDPGEVTLEIMGYEPETYYSAGSVSLKTTLTLAD